MAKANHPNDSLAALLSQDALDALQERIEAAINRHIEHELAAAIAKAMLTPWLDTKHAAVYLGISENAVRLRARDGLMRAHRDGAGRLRFHRDDLDQSMSPEPDKRRRRRS